jgi:hypothetical protein
VLLEVQYIPNVAWKLIDWKVYGCCDEVAPTCLLVGFVPFPNRWLPYQCWDLVYDFANQQKLLLV